MKEKLKDNMNGKICLVTGATNGIGKATAQALAQMGATVVIVGRDAQKTAQVTEEIRAASDNQNVDWLLADLSSQQDSSAPGRRIQEQIFTPACLAQQRGRNIHDTSAKC